MVAVSQLYLQCKDRKITLHCKYVTFAAALRQCAVLLHVPYTLF